MRTRTLVLAGLLGALSSGVFVACGASGSGDLHGSGGGGVGGGNTGYAGGEYGGASEGGGFVGTTTSSGTTTGTYTNYGGSGGAGGTTDTTTTTTTTTDVDAGADGGENACAGLDMSKPVVLYLSPDDSNSMGSPVFAREALKKGWAPGGIRTYEFLNYYRIAFTPEPAPALKLFAEAENGAAAGEVNLQLAVRSFDAAKPRRPMTLTFVLDTSGSMAAGGIGRERAAVKAIAKSLAKNDIVSMVTWNTDNLVVLDGHVVTGPNDPAIVNAATNLTADGGTDLHSGLVKGYQLAEAHYGQSRLNRVILISDGGANVGITDEDLIGLKSEDADKEGIYMVGVGAGPAEGYNDMLMDVVTDAGRGAYVYLDDAAEADQMFVNRFDETMEIAARGVQIELTMPWYFSIKKFSGEMYSPNPEEVRPQHLAPSDAMVLHQTLVACDPAVVNNADPVQMRVTWKTPLTYVDQESVLTTTVGELLAADKPHLAKGLAIVAYAEALKTQKAEDLADALVRVTAANVSGTDPELTEIANLITLHPSYVP